MITKFEAKELVFEATETEMNLYGNHIDVEVNNEFEYVNLKLETALGVAIASFDIEDYEDFKQEQAGMLEFVKADHDLIHDVEANVKSYFEYNEAAAVEFMNTVAAF